MWRDRAEREDELALLAAIAKSLGKVDYTPASGRLQAWLAEPLGKPAETESRAAEIAAVVLAAGGD